MLLFWDSFDPYTDLAQWWTDTQGAAIAGYAKRNGAQGCDVSFGSIRRSLAPRQALVVGFAVNLGVSSGFPSWGGTLYECDAVNTSSGLSSLCALFLEGDATLSLYAGTSGAFIANSAGVFSVMTDVWYYFELKFSFGGGTPITCTAEFRVNETVIMSGTGNTNTNKSTLLVNDTKGNYHVFAGQGRVGSHAYMDDLYINDQTAVTGQPAASGYRGDIIVGPGIYPAVDVTTQWTPLSGSPPSYAEINEHPPDGDTSYIYSSTLNQYDTFTFQPVATFVGAIQAAGMRVFARKDGEGARVIVPIAGNDVFEGPQYSISDTYFYYLMAMDVDPTSGAVWTVAGINAQIFGVKLVG